MIKGRAVVFTAPPGAGSRTGSDWYHFKQHCGPWCHFVGPDSSQATPEVIKLVACQTEGSCLQLGAVERRHFLAESCWHGLSMETRHSLHRCRLRWCIWCFWQVCVAGATSSEQEQDVHVCNNKLLGFEVKCLGNPILSTPTHSRCCSQR